MRVCPPLHAALCVHVCTEAPHLRTRAMSAVPVLWCVPTMYRGAWELLLLGALACPPRSRASGLRARIDVSGAVGDV
jgi:hypothetical protein